MKIRGLLKGFTLLILPYAFLNWMRRPLLLMFNTLSLSKWVAQQKGLPVLNDFYSLKRDYSKRYQLYQYLIDQFNLKDKAFAYLEFGVFRGSSFNWWLHHCDHPESKFYGFDTFEGLPENWGSVYNKGDMLADMPDINDPRGRFIKGLFQDSVPDFLLTFNRDMKNDNRKIIHLDADLFSSTLFVLTSIAPFLKKGDILMFDEFNVPNHEFFAFRIFSEACYVKTRLVGAVNNYFQVALMIE
jgi:O-methyltransferase